MTCEETVTLRGGEVVKCNGFMGEQAVRQGLHTGETVAEDGRVIGVIWTESMPTQ